MRSAGPALRDDRLPGRSSARRQDRTDRGRQAFLPIRRRGGSWMRGAPLHLHAPPTRPAPRSWQHRALLARGLEGRSLSYHDLGPLPQFPAQIWAGAGPAGLRAAWRAQPAAPCPPKTYRFPFATEKPWSFLGGGVGPLAALPSSAQRRARMSNRKRSLKRAVPAASGRHEGASGFITRAGPSPLTNQVSVRPRLPCTWLSFSPPGSFPALFQTR